MKEQIEQIMNKVESGDLAYHDAVDELLLLYNVSGSLPKNITIWKKAREMEFAYFRKWWFSRVGNDS